MASLNSLIVNGSARILGTLYANNLNVSGTTTFVNISASGNITATGNVTANGALYSGINGLYVNNKKVIYTNSTTDTWLRINAGK